MQSDLEKQMREALDGKWFAPVLFAEDSQEARDIQNVMRFHRTDPEAKIEFRSKKKKRITPGLLIEHQMRTRQDRENTKERNMSIITSYAKVVAEVYNVSLNAVLGNVEGTERRDAVTAMARNHLVCAVKGNHPEVSGYEMARFLKKDHNPIKNCLEKVKSQNPAFVETSEKIQNLLKDLKG